MPGIAVIDVDGVIADVRHRLHFVAVPPRDWDGFFDAAALDPVLEQGRAAVERALAEGLGLVYLTGRPERCRSATEAWLRLHHFPTADLLMRPNRDRRPARVLKIEVLRNLAIANDVIRLVDDDAAVAQAARDAGFDVVHATWMTQEAEEAQRAALGLAQEDLGRS